MFEVEIFYKNPLSGKYDFNLPDPVNPIFKDNWQELSKEPFITILLDKCIRLKKDFEKYYRKTEVATAQLTGLKELLVSKDEMIKELCRSNELLEAENERLKQ